MRGGGRGGGGDVEGVAEGEKPVLDVEVEACG